MSDDIQRKMAAEFATRVWSLLEREDRSTEEDDTMLHAAHASRFLWDVVLGRVDAASYHARRCLELCDEYGLGDFDRGYACEALARAAALAGDEVESARWQHEGRVHADRLPESEGRRLLESDLADL
jgi:hypothetical protein